MADVDADGGDSQGDGAPSDEAQDDATLTAGFSYTTRQNVHNRTCFPRMPVMERSMAPRLPS
jgi:hypothetical protein